MSELLGSGHIELGVHDAALRAGLERAEAEVKAAMDNMGRQKADPKVKLDLKEFDANYEEAKRKLRELSLQRADPKVSADRKKALNDEIFLQRKEVENARQLRDVAKQDLNLANEKLAANKEAAKQRLNEAKAHRDDIKQQIADVARVRAAEQRAEADALKADEQRRKAREREDRAEEQRIARESNQRAREAERALQRVETQARAEERASEQEAMRRAAQARRDEEDFQRQRDRLPEMQREQARLQRFVDSAEVRKRRLNPGTVSQRQQVDLDTAAALAKLAALREAIRAVGEEPVELHLRPARDAGRELRGAIQSAMPLREGYAFGQRYGEQLRRGVRDRFGREGLKSLGASIADSLGNGLSKLSSTTVRLGPFTSSIRGAIGLLSVLGPILIDVVGAAGSLVSVVGSATMGLGALSVGIAGGALPGLLGMGLVIKDVVQEFKAVKKAQTAYNNAVQQYGENSKQAAAKQAILQHVMGDVSKTTADQVMSAQDLGRAWDKATKPAHAATWTLVGKAIKTASDIMPQFARNTNEAARNTEEGFSGILRQIRSASGQGTLNTLMNNFNASIVPALHGLGQLGAALGKVGAIASGFLPGIMHDFDGWAGGLNRAANNTDAMRGKVQGWITSLGVLARFLQSTGRLIGTFFAGGTDAGNGFLATITKTEDKWTAFLKTADGQGKLKNFFAESVDGAKSLYGFLKPMAVGFVSWATALAPVARAAFDVFGAVTHAVTALLQMTALKSPLAALGYTLAAIFAVNRIGGFVKGLAGFTSGLTMVAREGYAAGAGSARAAEGQVALGAGAGEAAVAVEAETGILIANTEALLANGAAAARAGEAQAASAAMATRSAEARAASSIIMPAGVARPAAGAVAGEAAAATRGVAAVEQTGSRTMRVMRGLGGAIRGVGGALGGMAVAATGLSLPVIATVAGVSALTYGIYKLATRVPESTKAIQAAAKATDDYETTQGQVLGTMGRVITATGDYKNATRGAIDAQSRVNQLEKEGYTHGNAYKDALLAAAAAENDRKAARQAMIKTQQDSIATNKRALTQAGDMLTADQKAIDKNKSQVNAYQELAKAAKAHGRSVQEEAAAQKREEPFLANQVDWAMKGATAVAKLAADRKIYKRAQDLNVLGDINLARASQQLVPINASAAASFGALSRASSVAARAASLIATKFPKAGDAAKVANQAAKAVGAGTSGKMVLNIVANSKNAEDAINRLKRAQITDKRLNIIAQGGDDALAQLKNIVGVKLATKTLKVLGSTDSAQDKINALKRIGIPDKTARVLVDGTDKARSDLAGVTGAINAVKGKSVAVNAQANGLSAIQALKNAIGGVVGKTVSIVTNVVKRVVGGGKAMGGVTMRATGDEQGVPTAGTASHMDRAYARAEKGTLPRLSTTQLARGMKIGGGPRAIYGEEPQHPEYVISTNPSYRKNNIRNLRSAAQQMGLDMQAAPKAAAVVKDRYTSTITHLKKGGAKKWAEAAINTVMGNVDAAEQAEDNRASDLDRKISNIKEPPSFLVAHKDAKTGETTYTLDKGTQAQWDAQLQSISGDFSGLVKANDHTNEAIKYAKDIVAQVKANARTTITALTTQMNHAKGVMDAHKKDKNKTRYNNAKADYDSDKDQLSHWTDVRGQAKESAASLDKSTEDSYRRRNSYADNWQQYTEDSVANVTDSGDAGGPTGGGTSDATPAVPETPTPGAGTPIYDGTNITGYVSGTGAAGSGNSAADLEASQAGADLAKAQAGLPGAMSVTDALNENIKAQNDKLAEGQSMLTDADPTNDMQGYSIIESAASAIAGFQDQLKQLTATTQQATQDAAQQLITNSNTAKSMIDQYSSNIFSGLDQTSAAPASMAILNAIRGGSNAAVSSNAANGSGFYVAQGNVGVAGAAGDTTINMEMSFPTQPTDPHLWAQQAAFELKAAV